ANPASWASLVLFEQYFVEAERPDYAKLDELLTLLTTATPSRTALHVLAGQLSPMLKCRVGKRLPAFETVTLSGETVNNATLKGKTALISFWSTMSSEYIYPVSNQRRLLRKFGNRVAQLNICLDTDTTACCRVLRSDTIKGYNVCDLRSFGSPLVSVFGFRSLPSNILVDSTGVIRGRDIPPAELPKALASLGLK
ncbi:MAG: TlpA family protein disulfide reductase, partial [Bacteroidaceae bacterium]